MHNRYVLRNDAHLELKPVNGVLPAYQSDYIYYGLLDNNAYVIHNTEYSSYTHSKLGALSSAKFEEYFKYSNMQTTIHLWTIIINPSCYLVIRRFFADVHHRAYFVIADFVNNNEFDHELVTQVKTNLLYAIPDVRLKEFTDNMLADSYYAEQLYNDTVKRTLNGKEAYTAC